MLAENTVNSSLTTKVTTDHTEASVSPASENDMDYDVKVQIPEKQKKLIYLFFGIAVLVVILCMGIGIYKSFHKEKAQDIVVTDELMEKIFSDRESDE